MKDDIEKVIKKESRTVREELEDGNFEMVDKSVDVEYIKIPQEPIEIKKDDYLAQREMRKQELISVISRNTKELEDLLTEIQKINDL